MTDELCDVKGIARLTGLSTGTVRTYIVRSNRCRDAGREPLPGSGEALPAPDYRLGGSPVWRLDSLRSWIRHRDARSR